MIPCYDFTMCGKSQRWVESVRQRQFIFCWKEDPQEEERAELDSFAIIIQTWPEAKLKMLYESPEIKQLNNRPPGLHSPATSPVAFSSEWPTVLVSHSSHPTIASFKTKFTEFTVLRLV